MRRAECVVDVEDLTPARLLLQRMAYNITIGSVGYPGIKIQDIRSIRLLEAHTSGVGTVKEIQQAVLTAFRLFEAE
jgi:hypothetical protein